MNDTYDSLKVSGTLQLILRDANGNIKVDRTEKNIITTAGKQHIAARLANTFSGAGEIGATMGWMGVGTGTTGAVVGDTALQSALGARIAMGTPTSALNVSTFTCTFVAGVSTGAITEAGIFNALTGSTMLNRTTFAPVNKAVDDSLTINWSVTIA